MVRGPTAISACPIRWARPAACCPRRSRPRPPPGADRRFASRWSTRRAPSSTATPTGRRSAPSRPPRRWARTAGRGRFESGPTTSWAQVVLPWRPNGRSGWIRLDGRLRIHTAYWVRADLSSADGDADEGPPPADRVSGGGGRGRNPNADRKVLRHRPRRHRRSVRAVRLVRVRAQRPPAEPAGRLGRRRSAGDPRHQPPSSIGTAASAGCLRVSATALSTLRRYLRLGTPVVIRR